ncbi:hypothetical protein AYO43_09250 [Nitrospira sp. SCGC AG-212-E16]|nr:hypothetical protein AYO43_09250 [Nitrospira sp. SCGC AG-212-E16]
MDRVETTVVTIAGVVGFSAIWYWTDSPAAGWAFLAGAAVVGECANALAARLDTIQQAIKFSNALRGKGE